MVSGEIEAMLSDACGSGWDSRFLQCPHHLLRISKRPVTSHERAIVVEVVTCTYGAKLHDASARSVLPTTAEHSQFDQRTALAASNNLHRSDKSTGRRYRTLSVLPYLVEILGVEVNDVARAHQGCETEHGRREREGESHLELGDGMEEGVKTWDIVVVWKSQIT